MIKLTNYNNKLNKISCEFPLEKWGDFGKLSKDQIKSLYGSADSMIFYGYRLMFDKEDTPYIRAASATRNIEIAKEDLDPILDLKGEALGGPYVLFISREAAHYFREKQGISSIDSIKGKYHIPEKYPNFPSLSIYL